MDDECGRVYLQRNRVRFDHDRESHILNGLHFDSRMHRDANRERGELLHQRPKHHGNNDHVRDQRNRDVQRHLSRSGRNLLVTWRSRKGRQTAPAGPYYQESLNRKASTLVGS